MSVASSHAGAGDSVQTSPDSTSHEDTAMDTMSQEPSQQQDSDNGDTVTPDSQSQDNAGGQMGLKRTAGDTAVNGACDTGVKRIKSGDSSES